MTSDWRDFCDPTLPRTEPHPDDLLLAGLIDWDTWFERTRAERLFWLTVQDGVGMANVARGQAEAALWRAKAEGGAK